ncbi:Uncharacterized protein FWK35_00025948 [Aphis craccivora]|uniref:Uncharacterized protein n=1 Tax=Aphis craccivora TaxID=307492 RepID=A0A6G0W1S5_APHCR|nr:Uncharacterized protein FWK35_00025948 [Aphis craccivora]
MNLICAMTQSCLKYSRLVNQQNLIISCSNQKQIIKQIFGRGIISLSEQCSAASGSYHMIPYFEIDSDIVPSINIIRYTHKALNINNLIPLESIFENYEGYEIVTQNYTNNESILTFAQ